MTSQVHVMLDIETMGDCNDAAILSIGAVKFNRTDILEEFHVGVDLVSCMNHGLKTTPSTIMWWLHPDRAAAREQLLSLETIDLVSALTGFTEWYENVPTPNGDVPFPGEGVHIHGAELPIWGNGSTFDNVILRSAYATARMQYPAKFWNDQCYRTMKYRYPDIEMIREGTHHDALDDARSQAKHLQRIVAAGGFEL